MIILLDAGLENIGVVQKRIQFYFDANEISKNYIFGDKDNFSIELFADDDGVVYIGDRNIGAKYGKL